MKLMVGALILLVLFSAAPVAGQDLSFDTTIRLSPDFAHEIVGIRLNNTGRFPLEDFSYELPGDARNVEVYDGSGNLSYDILTGEGFVVSARFRNPVQPGSSASVYVEFDTDEFLSTIEGEHVFSALFSPPPGSRRLSLTVVLPRGMGLINPIASGARTDIAPLPTQTISDGLKTSFVWTREPAEELAVFIRYVVLTQPTVSATIPLQTHVTAVSAPDSRGVGLFLPLAAAALLLLLFYRFYFRRQDGGGGEVDLGLKTEFMRDDERLLIGLVRENEGIVQKRLCDSTGFSKAKVSKIVSELESRGIVRVERVGRRNKLFLSEEFKKGSF